MAKNAPKTTANTENNVYNQHKTTTCRITDEDEKNENTEPEKLLYVQQAQEFYHEPIENENSVFPLIASGDINQLLEANMTLILKAEKVSFRTIHSAIRFITL